MLVSPLDLCSVEIKELRLRPVTENHDYQVKLKQAQAFLQKVRAGRPTKTATALRWRRYLAGVSYPQLAHPAQAGSPGLACVGCGRCGPRRAGGI